jgi:hypothetical protein
MMLVMVQPQLCLGDMGLQGIVGIGQFGKGVKFLV